MRTKMVEGIPIIQLWDLPDTVLTKHAKTHLSRPAVRQRGNMILPRTPDGHREVYSDDPQYQSFIRRLYERLSVEVPPSKAKNGIWDARAVPRDWTNLMFTSGYSMLPIEVPIWSNDISVAARGDPTKAFLSPRHKRIFDIVADLFYDKATYDPEETLTVPRRSHTGAPFWSAGNIDDKTILTLFTSMNWQKIVSLTLAGKNEELARQYFVVYLAILGFRLQNSDRFTVAENGDLIPRERVVRDLLAAVTSGARGWTGPAKRIFMSRFKQVVYGMRFRAVWAMGAGVNILASAMAVGGRGRMFGDFPMTMHHTGAADLEQKIGSRHCAGVDIGQFDWWVTRLLATPFLDRMRTNFGEEFVKPCERMLTAPFLQIDPKGGADHFCVGDPFQTNDAWHRLPSGHGWNIDLGKSVAVALMLCAFDDEFKDAATEAQIISILQHEHYYSFCNMTDDNLNLFDDEGLRPRIKRAMTKPESWYMTFEYEDAPSFGGLLPYDGGDRTKVCHNVNTLIVNVTGPEHAVDSPSRRDGFALGWMTRKEVYDDAPMARTVYSTMEETFHDVYGHGIEEHILPYYEKQRMTLANSATKEYILNPSAIHYKIRPQDVDPDVLGQDTASLSADQVQGVLAMMANPNKKEEVLKLWQLESSEPSLTR